MEPFYTSEYLNCINGLSACLKAGSLIHWACFGSKIGSLIQRLGCHHLNALHCLGTPVGVCKSITTMYATSYSLVSDSHKGVRLMARSPVTARPGLLLSLKIKLWSICFFGRIYFGSFNQVVWHYPIKCLQTNHLSSFKYCHQNLWILLSLHYYFFIWWKTVTALLPTLFIYYIEVFILDEL